MPESAPNTAGGDRPAPIHLRRDPAPVLQHLINARLLGHEHRVLCYGCGQGVDVDWLRLRRYDVQGYDPHPPFGYAEPPAGPYDMVLLNYVLTRLKTADARRTTARKAFAQVKPGGRFVVTSRTALREAGAEAPALNAFFRELLDGCEVGELEVLPPDLQDRSVAAVVRKAGIYKPSFPWKWVDDRAEFEDLCARLLREPLVGLDVETTLEEPRVLCTIQLAVPGQTWIVDALAFADLAPIKPVLESDRVEKIIHNAAFEEQMFAKHHIRIVKIHDTLITSRKKHKKNISGGHKLGEVCERELGLYLDKSQQTSDWTTRPLHPDQLDYAAVDAEVLILLHRVLSPPKAPETLDLF